MPDDQAQTGPFDPGELLDEDAKTLKAVNRLSTADIEAFLNEHAPGSVCPFCATNSWTTFPPGEYGAADIHLWPPSATRDPSRDGFHVPAVLLTCRHCGFIRMHSAFPMGAWKLRQEGDSDA